MILMNVIVRRWLKLTDSLGSERAIWSAKFMLHCHSLLYMI